MARIHLVLVTLATVSLGRECQSAPFAIFELPHLAPDEDPISVARAISTSGDVVGTSSTGAIAFHPVIWSQRGVRDLGTLGGQFGEAWSVNDDDVVVGWAAPIGGGAFDERAFRWSDGNIVDLGTLGGDRSWATAINDLSQIVGRSEATPGITYPRFACIWSRGQILSLGAFDNLASEAHDVNSFTTIVGHSWSNEHEGWRAARWVDGAIYDLGSLRSDNGGQSWATAVNDLDQIVGYSDVDSARPRRAFLMEDQTMTDIGTIGGRAAIPLDVNNNTIVVGLTTRNLERWAMLWTRESGMLDLESLLPHGHKLRLELAHGINERGQVAVSGYALPNRSETRSYFMTPVTPEFNLTEPLPGLANQVNMITATGLDTGVRVYFIYGKRGGATEVPNCDILNAVLQISDARIAGSAVTDSNGTATLEMFVPAVARNLGDLLIQAVAPSLCQESQLVVTRFD